MSNLKNTLKLETLVGRNYRRFAVFSQIHKSLENMSSAKVYSRKSFHKTSSAKVNSDEIILKKIVKKS